jgi:uncharacterized protein DUF5680
MEAFDARIAQEFYVGSQAPHAFGTAKIDRQADGAKVITFAEGEWRSRDTFYGGEPYAGQVILYHRDRAVWSLVYYGKVHDTGLEVKQVYGFLRRALRTPDPERPFRGPERLVEGALEYRNRSEGDFTAFSGRETILEAGREVYWAVYAGGWINQRSAGAD